MTQTLTLDKEEFFSYPKTKREIFGNRRQIDHIGRSMLEMIVNLKENEALLTEQHLVPGTYRHAQNFLKRGPEVYTGTPKTQEDAMREQRGPGRRRLVAFEGVKSDDLRCAYVWTSMRDNKRRKVHLVDCLEGAKIFTYAHQTNDPEDTIKIKAYTKVKNVSEAGGIFDCKVPSRSRDGSYSFALHSVPRLGTKEQFYVWTHLHSSGHTGGIISKTQDTRCGSKHYDPVNFRSVIGEEPFCPHEIAAYLKISEQAGKDSQGRIMLQPFALPTPETVKFYRKVREQVMVRETKRSKTTGKTYRIARPFNEAEIEILLWQFTARKGYVDSWYASESRHGQRLRDYAW